MIWSLHAKASSGEVAQRFAAEYFEAPTQVQSLDAELDSTIGYRGIFRVAGCGRTYKLLGSRLCWSVSLA
jgi:hypothetical protein